MLITSATFIKSCPNVSQAPAPDFPEFTFVGRSNVGKSTLINMLTQRKQLAKASNTPGKTKLMNYFLINEQRYLVDLPGYGYAKASQKEKISWMNTMQTYLTERENLKQTFILIDGKLPPQKIDLEFIQIFQEEDIPFSIIITKIDKASQKELSQNTKLLKQALSKHGTLPTLFFASGTTGKGRDEILQHIEKIIENS